MKKKITAVFLAAILSAQPWGMAYAEDFSDDISVNSVESNETEEQETELPDVEEEPTEEDDSIVDEAEIQEGEETDDALSEVDIFSVGDEEVYIEDLSIISEPK